MKLGQKAMEILQKEITGKLCSGDDLVVAGPVGFEGTVLLVRNEKDFLRKFFSEGFLWNAVREPKFDFREIIGEEKISAVCQPGTGGILAAIWKMAEVSGVGLRADLRKIPVRQETIEICEHFDLDPYKLLAGGCILLGCPDGQETVSAFMEAGIRAAVIGKAVQGNDRLLKSGELTRYLERPSQDEITKLPWGNQWKSSGRIPGKDNQEGNI